MSFFMESFEEAPKNLQMARRHQCLQRAHARQGEDFLGPTGTILCLIDLATSLKNGFNKHGMLLVRAPTRVLLGAPSGPFQGSIQKEFKL
jgi:hypothetical protein